MHYFPSMNIFNLNTIYDNCVTPKPYLEKYVKDKSMVLLFYWFYVMFCLRLLLITRHGDYAFANFDNSTIFAKSSSDFETNILEQNFNTLSPSPTTHCATT